METNFFGLMSQMELNGELVIKISWLPQGLLKVSSYLENSNCKDAAIKLLPPFSLAGSPAELNAAFFQKINAPLRQVSGLLSNLESFEKMLKQAEVQSNMTRTKVARDPKAKKYEDQMAIADKLELEGKYRDAWTKLPDPALYPEYKEIIQKRRVELSAKFPPDLFGNIPEDVKENPLAETVEPLKTMEDEEVEYIATNVKQDYFPIDPPEATMHPDQMDEDDEDLVDDPYGNELF